MVVTSFQIFAGCGAGPSNEIRIGVQDQGYGLDWLNESIELYNEEHPESRVVIADSDISYSETVSAELKADSIKVDLIICAMINDIGEYVEKGRLVELSDVYASPYNDEETLEGALLEGAKIKCKHDGPDGALGYYAVPLDESLQSFIVNKTVVNFYEGQKSWGTRKKLAKVATVDDLVTWVSNIMSMSKQIPFTYLDGTGSGPVMGYTYPGMYMNYWEPIVSTWWAQYSGYEKYSSFFELKNPEAYVDEGRHKALEAFTKLKLSETALEGSAGFNHIDSQNAFISGKAVLIPNGIWIENESRRAIETWGADIEMIGVPAIDSKHKVVSGKGDNKKENYYYANAYYVGMIPEKAGEKIPAVKDFLSFLCSESEALRFTRITGGVRCLYQGYTKDLYGTMELSRFSEDALKKRDKAVALMYEAPQDAEAKNWKILRRNYASKWCYDPHYSEIIQKQDALSYVKSVYDKQYTTALSKFDEWCKKAGV